MWELHWFIGINSCQETCNENGKEEWQIGTTYQLLWTEDPLYEKGYY
jgi:hypothetical protein